MWEDFARAVVELLTLQATPTVYYVHAAMLCYAGGFLFRSQIKLRLLVLAGTALYIAYYWWHPAVPLWDAIFASLVIGVANLVGLALLTLDAVPLAMGRARELSDAFETIAPGTVKPGRVRRLARMGVVDTVETDMQLLRQGLRSGALHFILDGEASLHKHGTTHTVRGPCFLGEIAFVTGRPASADVTVRAGSRIVSWPAATLMQAMHRSGELDRSLRALVSYDLAGKLAASAPSLADVPSEPALSERAPYRPVAPCESDLFEPNSDASTPLRPRSHDVAGRLRAS